MRQRNDFGAADIAALLRPAQVAELLGVSARHVLQITIPQIRLGTRTIRYQREDVETYIKSRPSTARGNGQKHSPEIPFNKRRERGGPRE